MHFLDKVKIGVIAAVGTNGVIGLNGHIPWKNIEDQQMFRFITKNSLVVVGKNTWQTVRKLNGTYGREFICATRQPEKPTNWRDDLPWLCAYAKGRPVWLAGGEVIYREYAPWVNGEVIINRIPYEGPGDAFFPYDSYKHHVLKVTLL